MKKIKLSLILTFLSCFIGILAIAQDVVDPTALNNKIMAGYQGWFGAPNDGSGYGWIHWSSGTPNADNIKVDMWPDLREYDHDELFPTEFVYADLSTAGLFSSYTRKTVDRHFRWMKEYGIDGVFVQRFISSAKSRPTQRDTVLSNARWGAEAHGRVFANMYDVSGADSANFVQDIKNDWMHLVDDLKITESPNYLHHNGLPVLSIWGVNVGNTSYRQTTAQWTELLDWFTAETTPERYKVTLKAGVGNGWQSHSQAWQDVYDYFEFISPWAVGRYRDEAGADSYRNQYFQADLDETASRGMDYIPVVFPGFSWANLYEGNQLNDIPRNGGKFIWRQFYNAVDAGCNLVYIAMFDEVDEGTAIFKTTENKSQNPTTGKFLTLDIDGYDLPSDWYLRLAGEATKMLRGEISLTRDIPIVPYPENAEFVSQDVPTVMNTGETVSVSITMKNNGIHPWTDTENYLLGSISTPDSNKWNIKEIALETGESIAPGETKTFTFDITAPGTEGVYSFEWSMQRMGEIWFGKPSAFRLINVTNDINYLDDCDDLTDWNSSGSLSLNTSDQKQGTGCIEFDGGTGNDDEFNKVFSTPYNSGIAEFDAVLQFWYYVSDASLIGGRINISLGSGGSAGADEYTRTISKLNDGWNLITVNIKDAAKTGEPDLNAINWFSITSSKTGNVITRIDEIQIVDKYAGITRYILNVTDGVQGGLYAEGSIISVTANPAPPAQEFIGWKVDSNDMRIEDKYAFTTTIRMPAREATVTAQYKKFGVYLDDCDQDKDWGSAGILTVNSVDHQEGLACLEFNSSSTDEYRKVFSVPYNSGADVATGKLQFWYYVSDVSKLTSNNQVEIGSAGRPDQDEYSWNLSGLTNGWNFVSLDISVAGVIGEPDLSAINWFRLYRFKSGSVVTRIDAIEIIDPSKGERYPLTVYDGTGDGNYYAGLEVAITANPAPTQKIFDKWVIESGSPQIADINSANTILTVTSEAAVIRATYKEVLKYTLTVNNGSGSGEYFAGTDVVIQAEADTEDRKFIEWEVESGNVEISNVNVRFTYITMPEEDVVITAKFTGEDTHINLVESPNTYSFYPNPANSAITMMFSIEETTEVEISLLDVSGRIIKSFDNEKLFPGGHQFRFSVADVKKGTYILKTNMDNSVKSEVVIIN